MQKKSIFPRILCAMLVLSMGLSCGAKAELAADVVFYPDYPKAGPRDSSDWLAQKTTNPIPDALADGLIDFAASVSAMGLSWANTNLCYSPVSLYFALLLAAGGAKGETQKEMYRALGLTNAVAQGENPAEMAGALYRNLHMNGENLALKIAHSVWLQEPFTYESSFLRVAAAQYGELYSVDFEKPETAARLTKWIADNTRGLLAPSLTLSSDLTMLLFNTVYCKAAWKEPFQDYGTKSDSFYKQYGEEVRWDFMHGLFDAVYYGEEKGCSWASLPLEGGLTMTFYLPAEGRRLDSLLYSTVGVKHWLARENGQWGRVRIMLPKFAYNTVSEWKDLLIADMASAFTLGKADFTGITKTPIFISSARHDTRIVVEEGGIEAAAYTQLRMEATAPFPGGKPAEPFVLNLNRPFFYAITTEGGIPLFVGVVLDPTNEFGELNGTKSQNGSVPLFDFLDDPEITALLANFEKNPPVSVCVSHFTEGGMVPVTTYDPETIRAVFNAFSGMTVSAKRPEGGWTDDYLDYAFELADGQIVWIGTFQDGKLMDDWMGLHQVTGYDALQAALPDPLS